MKLIVGSFLFVLGFFAFGWVGQASAQDPPADPAVISGTVDREFPIASPASGVVIDRFTVLGDGSRGTYIDSATTNNDGIYTFTVDEGVYILTFIAPTGENWETTGTPWSNVPATATNGQTTTINQTLDSGITPVVAVDDNYTFTTGVPVVADLTANDNVVRNINGVEYVQGSGDLPPGMTIAFPQIGGVYQELRGTPTTPGNYTFQYRVSNFNGDTDTATVNVTIQDP